MPHCREIAFKSKSASFGEKYTNRMRCKIKFPRKYICIANGICSKPIHKKKNYHFEYQHTFSLPWLLDHPTTASVAHTHTNEHCNQNRMYLYEKKTAKFFFLLSSIFNK